MATPLDSLAQYIAVDLGIGAVGTVVFEDSLPDASAGTYDTAVAVISNGGAAPDLAIDGNTDSPGFLILSRSLDADTAIGNLTTIFQGIHGLHEQTVHGTYFMLIAAMHSGPLGMGRDERSRWMFSQSYRSLVRGTTR